MLPTVKTLDLNFQNIPGVIAAYLIPHDSGVILIECGPGSTSDQLIQQLKVNGYAIQDVTDVFLTHIHLDHAGAAGWLSRHGARIHVHPVGAPHLVDPSRLLASAARIYGDQMGALWGDFLPVPVEKIAILNDNQRVDLHGLSLLPLDTPGHASHHMVFLYGGICFSGDIGGVRMAGSTTIRPPMPPPELNLEAWRESLKKIASHPLSAIATTHFGIHNDPMWHLQELGLRLDQVEQWIEAYLPLDLPQEKLKDEFNAWMDTLAAQDHLEPNARQLYELAIPSFMSLEGILRYWRKYRQEAR